MSTTVDKVSFFFQWRVGEEKKVPEGERKKKKKKERKTKKNLGLTCLL